MSSTNRAPTSSQRGRPGGNVAGEHPLAERLGDDRDGVVHARCRSRTAARSSSVVCGVIRSTIVVTNATCSAIQSARPGSTAAASSPTTRATIAPLSGTLSQGTTATRASVVRRGGPRARATSLPGAVATSASAPSLAQRGDVGARPRGRSRSRPPSAAAPVAGLGDGEGDHAPAPGGRSSGSQASSSAEDRGDGARPPRGGRRRRRGRAACTARPGRPARRATAPRRPVKAAMPQSAASGACSVYQAWWARKKLPSPRWTIRTGAAGRPSRARASRRRVGCRGRGHSLNATFGVDRRPGRARSSSASSSSRRCVGDQLGEVAAVEPAGHVVAGRDGAERAGVVDEPGGAAEPGGLGDRAAVAADRLRGVEEPPRRAGVDATGRSRPAGAISRENTVSSRVNSTRWKPGAVP